MALKHGTEIELTLQRLVEKGRALGVHETKTVVVPFGVPGDRVRVRVVGKHRMRFEAHILEVLEPSPLRADPRCRFFGECGGCRWQNLLYAAQLDAKREAVIEPFQAAGILGDVVVPAVIGAPDTYFYRNKMEFSFGSRRWLTQQEIAADQEYRRDFALGMFVSGHFDRVLDLDECFLQTALTPRVLNTIRALALEEGWNSWDARRHEGYLRHLVIRTPTHGDGVLVNLVTNGFDQARMEVVKARLQRDLPEVTTLVNTINRGLAQVSTGETVYTIFGDGQVIDRIHDLEFEIGPHTFFQTNTRQAERLYEIARDFAEFEQDDTVFDLFCGIGTISLYVAPHVREVVGLELDQAAVAAARRNAERNGIQNVRFEAADLGKSLALGGATSVGRPDIVITDPPRAGMHKKALHWILDLRPERVVYVSCNPKTQAEDILGMSHAYDLVKVQPVDLFPQTDHVENVALLVRKGGRSDG